ncbi:hypothetical protein DMR37_29925 [Klebsiella pneumoniae]|nr:hypothetical protein DMR37_29925 [Klebsiella pneumoniae]
MQFQGLILLSSAESLYKRAVCWFARRKKFSVAQIQAVLNFSVLYQQFTYRKLKNQSIPLSTPYAT